MKYSRNLVVVHAISMILLWFGMESYIKTIICSLQLIFLITYFI